jgi:hypothetical protein
MTNQLYHKLLYFYFQDYIFDLPEYEKNKYISEGFFGKIKMMVIALLLRIKEAVVNRPVSVVPRIYGSNWVFVFGKNNYDATNFLTADDFVFVTDKKRIFQNSEDIIQLPYRVKFRHYLNFLPLYFYLLKMEGRRTYKLINIIFNSIGWMEAFEEAIVKFKPKSIIFSNDHSYIPRALFLMAKKNDVPTIYIQHATVTNSFPALEFDLSLLEGQDAFDKYSTKGIYGKVKFIGMPRFDKFFEMRRKTLPSEINTIGFAFNTVDSIQVIYEILRKLLIDLPSMKIIIRRHSKDTRDFKTPLSTLGNSIFFSDPLSEDPFAFLLNCDLLIAGDSAIHLDAGMMNVSSYYFNFASGSKIKDLYGFIKSGFIRELAGLDDLLNQVKNGLNGNNDVKRAAYYNHLAGTDQEAHASEFALHEIRNFLAGL